MDIKTNFTMPSRVSRPVQSPPASSAGLLQKVSDHFQSQPLDGVGLALESVITATSALEAGGTFNGMIDGLNGFSGIFNIGLGVYQGVKSRNLTGKSATVGQLRTVGSCLRGLGMIGSASGMGPVGLAIYGIGAAADVYADVMKAN